jgi:Holliday junction resolvasome RuvABC DNA-binding subunit
VLDLKETLGGGGEPTAEGPLADAREALLSLGLTPAEASEALADIEPDGQPVEEILRRALQRAGR